MTEGPHAPKYVFVYTYPGYLSTRTYYLKWIEAYRKALIPVYAVCRTKKLKMEKNLFDMDAHGPPFPKKKIFFSCDFPKLFHCSCDCILSRLCHRGITYHVKNHLLKFFWTKIKFTQKK